MSYTYAQRKAAASVRLGEAQTLAPERMDALRRGVVKPTAAEKGHRIDLPEAMRARMESSFGADLSAVKLYESQTVADAGANAITQGSSISFAPGKADFSSRGGQELLGHELSHVVSQARGQVTGGGFLNDSALEARADREGALAAAGESVFGGAAAPLSGASATAASGPMQASKEDKDQGDYKAQKLIMKNHKAPSAEDMESDQIAVDKYGDELKQDTDWNMESASVKKKGFFERNLGKYFYKNNSAKNIAKNIGIGTGLAIGAIPLALFKGLKTGATKFGSYLKRNNQEAVDVFNNNEEDYRKMSGWERFKFSLRNPIARATARWRKKGTQERNLRRTKIAAAAAIWQRYNKKRIEDSDVNFDALQEIPEGEASQDPGSTQDDLNPLHNSATVAKAGKSVEPNIPLVLGDEKVQSIPGLKGDASGLSKTHRVLGAIGAGLGGIAGMLDFVENAGKANNAAKVGDTNTAATAGLNSIGTAASTTSDVLSLAAYAGGLANPGIGAAIPGLTIASGAVNTIAGITQTAGAGVTRKNMTASIKELDEREKEGGLSEDQKRMRKAFKQAHGVAKADQAEGIMKTVAGGLQTAGGAMMTTGAGLIPGTAAVIGAALLDFAGGKVGKSKRASVGNQSLEEETDFTKQREIVKRRFKNLHLSDREAEDLVLHSMGVHSGDKKEAVQRMTMNRAFSLTKAANNEQDENHEIALKGLRGMGLKKVNGKFSLQGVAEKLGFNRDESWRDQMKNTRNQGAFNNPFREKVLS